MARTVFEPARAWGFGAVFFRFVLRCLALPLVLSGHPVCAAEAGVVKLEAIPSSLKLFEGEARQVIVVAHTSTNAAIPLAQLDWISSSGLVVTNHSGAPKILPAQGGVSWLVSVTKTNASKEAGQVHFRLDHGRPGATGVLEVADCAIAALEISDRAPTALENVVEIRLESALKLLQEPRTGTVHVVVKNKASFPLTVESLRPEVPSDLIVSNLLHGGRIVAPRQEASFPITLAARSAVQSGKHLLLVAVDLAWTEENRPLTATLISKYEFDVGVLGDSEFLVPVGVPSFLLLPGFLMIMFFAMPRNRFGGTDKLKLEVKSAEFWSIAVVLSLLYLLCYRVFTQRNLLEGYGLKDVYSVWLSLIHI